MNYIKFTVNKISFLSLAFIVLVKPLFADENIIQQEKLSFERCINVISVSEDKLSIAPEITKISNKKQFAVFTLSDGTLTITCNGNEGVITVSTKTN